MKNTNQINTHMEYLGYIVTRNEEDENILYCSKPGYTPFMVMVDDARVWFYADYEVNTIAKCNKDKVFRYINDLNSNSNAVTFFINDDLLRMSTNYTGNYDRSMFSAFISQVEYDVNDLLASMKETNLYLGDPEQAEYYLQDNTSNGAWVQA